MAAIDQHSLSKEKGSRAWALGMSVAAVAMLATAGQAQQANFDSFTLSNDQPTASVQGFTNGIFPLSNLAGRDRRGIVCTGFADSSPDHIMVLQQDMTALTLRVNSSGNDTSLLVQGPNNTVRCGQDTDRRNPDAQIQDQNWPAGTYQVWVGSHNQGQRYNYTLTVSP